MTANLTPAEARAHNAALEKAAELARDVRRGMEKYRTRKLPQVDEHTAAVCDALADRIAALSAPIPPELDVEAVVEMAARGMSKHWACDFDTCPAECECRRDARAVVAALTAAGMLKP